jgi:gluconolactonase
MGGNAGSSGAMGGSAGGTGGQAGSGGAMGAGGTGGQAGGSGGTGSGGGPGVGGGPGTGGGSGGIVNTGGSTGRGGTGGGNTNTGGGSGQGGGRSGGICRAGTQYPAPDLTGTAKLLYKPSGSSSGTYEGPVWVQASGVLLFSDMTFTTPIDPSQILKLAPPSTEATFLQDSGTNGMAIDGSGTVFACSHKVQGIVKLDFSSAMLTTVVDNYNGKTFNSPNDIVVRSDGTIYFTDPDFQLGSRTSATGKKGIYRVSPAAQVSLVDDTFAEPNGVTLSPDESVLYVADYNGNVVRTFSVAADGSTSGRKDFVTVTTPDGFAVDCAGNLYVASGTPGVIQVYSPSGTKLGSVTVVASLSNMAFGGSDGKTLYITAGKALYSLDMNLPGYPY